MKLLGQYTQQHDNIAWRLGGGGRGGGDAFFVEYFITSQHFLPGW